MSRPENHEPPIVVQVLLVDDNAANLVAMSAAIEGAGTRVVTAASGDEALVCLLNGEFAAILMDVQMPGMDGFETAALIRGRPRAKHTPIIFLTAINQSEEHAARGYALGAVDYVFKPVAVETLRAKVAVFVDLARSRALLERQAEALREANHSLRVTADALRLANAAAAFANHELEMFNSAVAHDLRAPLRSIHGFSAALLLNHANQLDSVGREDLGRVMAAAVRMGQLIDDLLGLSHCTRSQMRFRSVDLTEIASECLTQLQSASPERCVDIRVAPGLMTQGDPRLLRVVMENLLRNAWKFTAHHPKAVIEVGKERGTGAFFVRDDGAGFDMAYANKLFMAFQRLHRLDEFEGNGIGLITVKRIVERHGGRIRGVGVPEQGATFFFTLGDGSTKELSPV
ncbi:MAG: response regulator [Pseudomonadota bacterium]|nr:response regulator [Pseudomonadota bacterium]